MSRSCNLQIGEIATLSGVSVDTVRYYERLKLLPRAARSNGGYRIFPAETVERIRFIKQAQEMNFSLDEIKELLAGGGANECRRVRDLLRDKLDIHDERMRAMKNFRTLLVRHLASCESELEEADEAACCPVLHEINHPERA